jgi:hypothetical protein
MATLTNIINHVVGAGAVAEEAARAGARCDDFRLRALPNEDVFFYIKRIDNSRVVRQADPRSHDRDWKVMGGASIAAAALICLLLPSAWAYMAGYELSKLQAQNQHLAIEKSRLELEEASLLSAKRLQELADVQQYVDPAPGKTHYLPKADTSLALNHGR